MNKPLTKKGLKDSKKITEYFKDIDIGNVYVSPYKRVRETLCDYCTTHDMKPIIIQDFHERLFGDSKDSFEAFSIKQWNDFDYYCEGGESLNVVQKRNIDALSLILANDDSDPLIIGTHGTALAMILNNYIPEFNYDNHLEFRDLLPFICKVEFKGQDYVGHEIIEIVEREDYQNLPF